MYFGPKHCQIEDSEGFHCDPGSSSLHRPRSLSAWWERMAQSGRTQGWYRIEIGSVQALAVQEIELAGEGALL